MCHHIMAVEHPTDKKMLGFYVLQPGEWRESSQSGQTLLLGSTSRPIREELREAKNYILMERALLSPPACLMEDVWVVMVVLKRGGTSKRLYKPLTLVVQNGTRFKDIGKRDLLYTSGPFSDEDLACEVVDAVLETAIESFLLQPTNSLTDIVPTERRRFTHLVPPKVRLTA